jgi:predicted transposase/invertase (TIGR01784 family)
MRIGIDPKVDVVFKKLFGSEENKALLLDLVNSVMRETRQPKVDELEILNPYNPKNFLEGKLSIVDIKAKDEIGQTFIIEVQIQVPRYFPQRLLYYWAKAYESQLKQGENYRLLNKVLLICFLAQSLPIAGEECYNLFQVVNRRNKKILCDDLFIFTVELSKFLKDVEDIGKPLDKWSYLLKYGEDLDEDELPASLKTPPILQAVREIKMFTLDEMQREIYESRRKAIMDEVSKMADKFDSGFQEGIKKGEEIGIKKGEEIGIKKGLQEAVRKALEIGLDPKTIQQFTSVSLAEIETIRKAMKK